MWKNSAEPKKMYQVQKTKKNIKSNEDCVNKQAVETVSEIFS
jgi:hypothetical protein